MNQMPRIMVFSHLDTYLFDIDPELVRDAPYVDAINGEHSLTITTTQRLEKTNRLLIRDGMGEWHEYVVQGITELHDVTEYYCVWSLQYDLANTFVDDMYGCGYVPGHASVPQAARKALECALEGTERWEIGTITVTTQASSSFYRRSGWEAMKTVIEKWGGELHATITVGSSGVTSREVDLLAHIGASTATRRFDYGHDLKDIKRTTSDDSWPCRIVPLGKAQETDAGGYSRRPDISSVNGNVMWLEDSSVTDLVKVPKPGGGYEYPTVIVLNDTYEAPSDLKAWAQDHIQEYTRPQVSYEGSVVQFERAGMNVHGVALGDNVVAVDRLFCGEGLRIDARVVRIAGNLLDPTSLDLTIGNAVDTLTNSLMGIARQVSELTENLGNSQQYQATADYVSALVSRLNQAINAVGGYCYMTEGEGFVTYDYPVSDPLVGAEATKVVEMRGGNIRIADSRTAGGDWDWKTLIQSGHVAANLVTAVNIVAGFIGNANGSYWDLDSGTLAIGSSSTIAGRSVNDVIDAVDATITGVDVEYAENQSATVPPAQDSPAWATTAPAWREDYYIWQRTKTVSGGSVSYSSPTCISGRDGRDGTSVTILGSYNTLAELQAAHQTGSAGDSYMVAGDLYVWNGSAWEDVGQIQGPQGPTGATGAAGASVTVSKIEYGTSSSASTAPTNYTETPPSTIALGSWLWVKTTYSDGSNATTKSHVGTNGTNGTPGADAYTVLLTNESHTFAGGTSAAVASSTTSYIIAYKGTNRIAASIGTITGAPTGMTVAKSGSGTTNAYISVSVTTALTTRQGMLTIPVTVDGKSFTLTFSWSLALKGATGETGPTGATGATGIGVSSIVEQYYLSTSPSAQTGGSWSSAQPAWESGKYIWTRSVITWSDGRIEPTSPVLAKAINGANQTASDANQAASNAETTVNNYLRFSPSTGLEVGYEGNNNKVVVEGGGVQLYGEYDNDPIKTAKFAYIDRGYDTVYGKGPSLVMGDPDDYDYGPYCIVCGGSALNAFSISVGEDAYTNSLNCQAFGEGVQALEDGAAAFGRESVSSGSQSHAEGYQTEASGSQSHAEGYQTEASGNHSHAEGRTTVASAYSSHAEGASTTASGSCSHAEGQLTVASGSWSHASGLGTKATRDHQFVCGEYNANNLNNALFEVGSGASDSDRRSAFVVSPNTVRMFQSSITGYVYVNGSTVHGSDRRIKNHDSYIDRDEAAEFIRKLKPALYEMKSDGTRHVGFYAQDVQEADPWDTKTVIEGDDELLSLDYTALIAPLVAYTQQLENRIDALERRIDKLTNGGSL